MRVAQAPSPNIEVPQLNVRVTVVQSGEWMEAEELRRNLAARVTDSGNIVLDCEGIGDVDACSFQILLGFIGQRQSSGGTVGLRHVSAGLAQWFGYAGAAELMELASLGQEA